MTGGTGSTCFSTGCGGGVGGWGVEGGGWGDGGGGEGGGDRMYYKTCVEEEDR
jgi:hypothetical protein